VTTLLVLQPSALDPLGPLEGWLTGAGAQLHLVRPFMGDAVPVELSGVDGVVCLGGEMGAADDAEHPWLPAVRAVLAAAVAQRVPVLAICLGAQVLALACGGSVRPMPQGPEAGVRLVAKRDAAAQDPLLADLPFTPDVVQFHSDEVSRLPAGATLLAVSPHCTNQAFRVGTSAWGLQFHIETSPELLRAWMDDEPEVAAVVPRSQHPCSERSAEVLERAHVDLEQTWEPVARRVVGQWEHPPVERRNLLVPDEQP
jgi:GMP synthase-like glutamine amidotransferase